MVNMYDMYDMYELYELSQKHVVVLERKERCVWHNFINSMANSRVK